MSIVDRVREETRIAKLEADARQAKADARQAESERRSRTITWIGLVSSIAMSVVGPLTVNYIIQKQSEVKPAIQAVPVVPAKPTPAISHHPTDLPK